MRTETIELVGAAPGTRHTVQALHYGQPGRGPKAFIQAALHADEIPALVVAHALRGLLAGLDAAGQVVGEVVLVPCANPIGLGQHLLGQHHGRFDFRDGVNFNRLVPDLTDAVAAAVEGRLDDDEAVNAGLIRAALREAAAGLLATQPVADLKRRLLTWAADADIVLDLHCDGQASLHLYGLTPQAETCAELGALLGAQAILLATESGDAPFDEACSRPWLELQRRFPQHPIPLGCFSSTVELRGEADTDEAQARQDALALLEFLRRRGVLAGAAAPLPPALCLPTPLASSEPVTPQHHGALVFLAQPGDRVSAGDVVAHVLDVQTGERHALIAQSSGVLYARIATRWAQPGRSVAKIAGTTLARKGKLLGA
jgi:predicted deacylase